VDRRRRTSMTQGSVVTVLFQWRCREFVQESKVRHVGTEFVSRSFMPFEIPNYDSIVGRAARPITEDSIPAAAPSLPPDDGWDPNRVELDMEELDECLSRR
jgi:hypothetical protein